MNVFKLAIATAVFAPTVLLAATLKVDTTASKLSWVGGKEVGGSHNGTISLAGGEFIVEKDKLQSGTINVDMKSIAVVDVTDPKKNKDLKDHLSNDDFFAAEKFPTATLKIKSVKESTPGKAEVTGDLTIRGKTEPVTFPVDLKVEKGQLTAKGKLSVDRTKFDVKYGSSNFFKLAADRIIKNAFDLEFDITAK